MKKFIDNKDWVRDYAKDKNDYNPDDKGKKSADSKVDKKKNVCIRCKNAKDKIDKDSPNYKDYLKDKDNK